MSLPTSSPALIEANRHNAQFSTGPRSVAGKARACRNAVSHGMFAKTLILHGEDPSELDQLRQALHREHQPITETEAILVERIVVATWKLRRVAAAEQALYELEGFADLNYLRNDRRQVLGLEPEKAVKSSDGGTKSLRPKLPGHVVMAMSIRGKDPLEKVQLHEQRLENSIHRSLRQLRDLRKQRGDSTENNAVPSNPLFTTPAGTVEAPQADEGLHGRIPEAALSTHGQTVESDPAIAAAEPLSPTLCPVEGENRAATEMNAAVLVDSAAEKVSFDETNPNPALSPENHTLAIARQLLAEQKAEAKEWAKTLKMLYSIGFAPDEKAETPSEPPERAFRVR